MPFDRLCFCPRTLACLTDIIANFAGAMFVRLKKADLALHGAPTWGTQ